MRKLYELIKMLAERETKKDKIYTNAYVDYYIEKCGEPGYYYSSEDYKKHIKNTYDKRYVKAKPAVLHVRNKILSLLDPRLLLEYVINNRNLLTLEKFIRNYSKNYHFYYLVSRSNKISKIVECIRCSTPKITFNSDIINNPTFYNHWREPVNRVDISLEDKNILIKHCPVLFLSLYWSISMTSNEFSRAVHNVDINDEFCKSALFNRFLLIYDGIYDIHKFFMTFIMLNDEETINTALLCTKKMEHVFKKSSVPTNFKSITENRFTDCLIKLKT